MATYKAEFLSHYWKRRLRPLSNYLLGLIYWEARVASRMPRLANWLAHGPLSNRGKRLVGIAPERKPPAFAEQTFTAWFAERGGSRTTGGRRVLLWPDTFNNHFHPEVAIAATEVLEAAGFEVTVPSRSLCCGRPLYDYGMLTLAKRQLRQILDVLRGELRAGTPIVALEPSCGAVFRDELPNLFPADEDGKRLKRQTRSLGELLAEHLDDWSPPRLERRALVHLHCHQRATCDTDTELAVLDRMGLDYEVPDSGCCGLAGSFGYEAGERYDVSVKAGERVLLPAIRDDPGAIVVTDGFSCRSQIEHGTGRRSLHIAELVQLALRSSALGAETSAPAALASSRR